MSKTLKLKNNNFWDSSSVVHNRTSLDTILNRTDFYTTNMSGYGGYWCRVATQVFTGQYRRFWGRLFIDNDGYEPGFADVFFTYYSQNSITSSNPFIINTKVITTSGMLAYSNRLAITIEGTGTSSVRVSLWVYEAANYSSFKVYRVFGDCDITGTIRATSLPGSVTYLNQ